MNKRMLILALLGVVCSLNAADGERREKMKYLVAGFGGQLVLWDSPLLVSESTLHSSTSTGSLGSIASASSCSVSDGCTGGSAGCEDADKLFAAPRVARDVNINGYTYTFSSDLGTYVYYDDRVPPANVVMVSQLLNMLIGDEVLDAVELIDFILRNSERTIDDYDQIINVANQVAEQLDMAPKRLSNVRLVLRTVMDVRAW